MWVQEVGDLSFQELLVRGWKTGRGNPVVEFNLDMNVSIRNVRKKTFHLSLYFHERSVPVDLNVVVAGILDDKFNLQCWTITPNVIIAVR